ncbi:MAG: type II secretion system protein N [Betaproteobacteria bacterium]
MNRRALTVPGLQPKTTGRARPAAWLPALVGLMLGVGLALLTQAPARWLAPWVAGTGHLQLLDAQGTLWQGSARLQLTGGPGSRDQALLPDRIEWQTGASWSALHLDIKALCCTSEPLRLSLGWAGSSARLSLADHRSLWPADVLSGLGTPWNTLQPTGKLQLQTQGLSWDLATARLQGGATVDLQDLGSALSTIRPIGHYRLSLQGADTSQLTLSTVEGALQLQGQGQWLNGRWRFKGHASTEPALEPALGNLLNIIGRREGARSIISFG